MKILFSNINNRKYERQLMLHLHVNHGDIVDSFY